jgi:hypothetical protein
VVTSRTLILFFSPVRMCALLLFGRLLLLLLSLLPQL